MCSGTAEPAYVGRFAPSPTGPLHFGSLVAALASYLDARHHHGRWLVRMEDLDPPREQAGADTEILSALENAGLEWDGPVLYQGTRQDAYLAALQSLQAAGACFPCGCTRREVGPGAYPGTCRDGLPEGRVARSVRARVPDAPLGFSDAVQGRFEQALRREVGDFIIRRADGLIAYHLAVTVDDGWQGVSHVVRGADLMDSTPRQLLLQRQLGLPALAYAHVPTVLDSTGNKLSKQHGAAPLKPRQIATDVFNALRFLGQRPPAEPAGAAPRVLLDWAVPAWRLDQVPAHPGATLQPLPPENAEEKNAFRSS